MPTTVPGRSDTSRVTQETYTHGHAPPVLRSHSWRTAENSAGYLLPRLRPTDRLLDVGCGPGTITLDLADAGSATAGSRRIDSAPAAMAAAQQAAANGRHGERAGSRSAMCTTLDFADDSFDVTPCTSGPAAPGRPGRRTARDAPGDPAGRPGRGTRCRLRGDDVVSGRAGAGPLVGGLSTRWRARWAASPTRDAGCKDWTCRAGFSRSEILCVGVVLRRRGRPRLVEPDLGRTDPDVRSGRSRAGLGIGDRPSSTRSAPAGGPGRRNRVPGSPYCTARSSRPPERVHALTWVVRPLNGRGLAWLPWVHRSCTSCTSSW